MWSAWTSEGLLDVFVWLFLSQPMERGLQCPASRWELREPTSARDLRRATSQRRKSGHLSPGIPKKKPTQIPQIPRAQFSKSTPWVHPCISRIKPLHHALPSKMAHRWHPGIKVRPGGRRRLLRPAERECSAFVFWERPPLSTSLLFAFEAEALLTQTSSS